MLGFSVVNLPRVCHQTEDEGLHERGDVSYEVENPGRGRLRVLVDVFRRGSHPGLRPDVYTQDLEGTWDDRGKFPKPVSLNGKAEQVSSGQSADV